MPKENATNPHTTNSSEVSRISSMPVQRATVVGVSGHQSADASFHTARIRIYGDPSPYMATVLTPSRGDVAIPTEGDDVAVVFGESGQPFIIGYWYAADKVEDGTVDLPHYEPGERIIGTPHNDSHIAIREDGTIEIVTEDYERVDIDHQTAVAYLSTDQDIAGDDQYYRIDYDSVEDDQEELLDQVGIFKTRHEGLYDVNATVAIPSPGQNVRYSLAIFINDSEEKRKSRQSAVNEELSLDVSTYKRLDEDDEVDVRLRHDRGSSSTVNGSQVTAEASISREGI